eukprot:scaffold130319_cov60-Phaeocystis_antarctica.AAC.5
MPQKSPKRHLRAGGLGRPPRNLAEDLYSTFSPGRPRKAKNESAERHAALAQLGPGRTPALGPHGTGAPSSLRGGLRVAGMPIDDVHGHRRLVPEHVPGLKGAGTWLCQPVLLRVVVQAEG